MPKESNPNSLTSFLGRFDPFRNEVPLNEKDRMNDPIKYNPKADYPEQGLVGLGLSRDFRTGRMPQKVDNVNFKNATSIDPRILNSAYLNVNPKTLDEMITAPGTGTVRFNALRQKLAEQKKRQDLLNSVKEQQEDEEADELMKNR